MRPLFDSGLRAEAFHKLLKELHTKEYYKKMMQREYTVLQRKSSGINQEHDSEYFSEFSNKSKHNGKIPSRNYIVDMHKRCHYSTRN